MEKKYRVKSKEELLELFRNKAYMTTADGYQKGDVFFNNSMFSFCSRFLDNITWSDTPDTEGYNLDGSGHMWTLEWLDVIEDHTEGYDVYIGDKGVRSPETDNGTDTLETNKEFTDKHYNCIYKLTEKNIEDGFIKLDPYFLSLQLKLGSRDESGALWHIFKTTCRFGDKNSIEREILAMDASIKRMKELYGIDQ